MDNMPPYTGVIEKGGLTNDSRPTASGRGDAGSIIHVLVDGREVGTAVVKANGTWSFALPQSLRDGEYRLTARASNDAGWSVPSTSYGIVVDTTPPSRPTIEAATEGAQPTLSGRAEAYSTVTVYDGTKVLGTATTGIDGAWTFKLPSGLSNGTHSLTVTAMDPAGNTSVVSAGFDVTIGPVAPLTPTTQAILDEMGRDSGSFNFDRLTNDGTAGRLLSGHLTAALATGEKVQVSTDGGKTWVDAVMKSDGTWVAVDSNAHTGSWTVKTRVANDDGATGPQKAYDVTLDVAAPGTPGSAVRSGNVIDVSLSGTGCVAGDMLNVMIGDHRIAYTLTAAEVAAGRVRATIPASIAVTLDEHASYGVALVDISGNVSDYRVTRFEEVTSGGTGHTGIDFKITDFNAEKPRDMNAGVIPVDLGTFSLSLGMKADGQGIRVAGGNTVAPNIKPEAGETGLLFWGAGTKFFLNGGAHAQSLTIDVGFSTQLRKAIDFYGDDGKLVYRYALFAGESFHSGSGGAIHAHHIVLPDNIKFSSFGFSQDNGGGYQPYNMGGQVWVDNVGFAGGDFNFVKSIATTDFNSEKPRDIVASFIPVNFGTFSLSVSSGALQGIRVAGGNTVAPDIKPEVGETGLLIDRKGAKFFLNDGASAQSLAIDIGFSKSSANRNAIDFFDGDGNLVYRYPLSTDESLVTPMGIHSYYISLPDDVQFSSFCFSKDHGSGYYPENSSGMAWIDNVGFAGGSFTKSSWEAITEVVPPADIQHVLVASDAAYYGSSHGTEFQLDHVSYFSGTHAGLHGGVGIDTLKLTGANELLDLSKLIHVDGSSKLSSIEIIDITGTGDNVLKLSMRDVLELGHENLFRTDGHTQMMVKGNAGDRVELSGMSGLDDGHWANQGMVAVDGMAYVVYENTALNVELLVQSAVSTQLV
ncbi:Ig-like domain-containing protein [Burkholderia cepacia]|uniref:Ig-like domain-containing protein n=1 Tax=Burkholderia cepacia TaxID=292 RepID=UPI0018C7D556|nr:Ig-like domain-containing protein [Burkholderia cepacia]